MTITQLEYFCSVSRYGSITQAAKKLYVTQPAISTAIRELEKEFSVSLFIRSKNQLTLTTEGKRFLEKTIELLDQVQRTSLELHDLCSQAAPLRIGIPPLMGTLFFPEMLIEFRKDSPGISAELFEYGSIKAASLVQEETLDLAIVNMHFPETSALSSGKLLTDRLAFCVSGDHPLAGEKEVHVTKLANEELVLYNTDSVQNQTILAAFDRFFIKPKVILHSSQLESIKNFVLSGVGGAILYSSVAKQNDELAAIPIIPAIEQDIGLIWKKGRYLTNSMEKFIAFALKYATKKYQ